VLFSYFYASIILNPREVAENLKKNGSAVQGVKPGKPTSDYLDLIKWIKLVSRYRKCSKIKLMKFSYQIQTIVKAFLLISSIKSILTQQLISHTEIAFSLIETTYHFPTSKILSLMIRRGNLNFFLTSLTDNSSLLLLNGLLNCELESQHHCSDYLTCKNRKKQKTRHFLSESSMSSKIKSVFTSSMILN